MVENLKIFLNIMIKASDYTNLCAEVESARYNSNPPYFKTVPSLVSLFLISWHVTAYKINSNSCFVGPKQLSTKQHRPESYPARHSPIPSTALESFSSLAPSVPKFNSSPIHSMAAGIADV